MDWAAGRRARCRGSRRGELGSIVSAYLKKSCLVVQRGPALRVWPSLRAKYPWIASKRAHMSKKKHGRACVGHLARAGACRGPPGCREKVAVTILEVARFDLAGGGGLDAVDHDEMSAYTSSENMRSSSTEARRY